MLELLNVLEKRAILKKYLKNGATAAVGLTTGQSFFAKVSRVGLTMVTFEILDDAEETWLATESLHIADILSFNHDSVDRARFRLMMQNAAPGEEPCASEYYEEAAEYEDE